MPRRKVKTKTSDEVLAANRHTCCMCHERGKNVQLHHIDGDNANNEHENLAVVCLDCHSKVTGNEGLGRSYSTGEVSIYKAKWEEACSSASPTERRAAHGLRVLLSTEAAVS